MAYYGIGDMTITNDEGLKIIQDSPEMQEGSGAVELSTEGNKVRVSLNSGEDEIQIITVTDEHDETTVGTGNDLELDGTTLSLGGETIELDSDDAILTKENGVLAMYRLDRAN